MLEGRAYRLKYPWVGVVNRSQADINKNVDMIAARRREREYFSNTPEYKHLAHRMGSEHLAKMLSKVNNITIYPYRALIGCNIYYFFLFYIGVTNTTWNILFYLLQ